MVVKAKKKSTGRKCAVCSHKQMGQINTLIGDGVSFRSIASQYGMSDPAVGRHAQNCLQLEIKALIQENKIKNAIDVHEEFREQLDFAKALRIASKEYLADTSDPLKMVIIPRADEIDVVYYDMDDLTAGKNPVPKKKTAKLSALIHDVEDLRNLEVDKVNIKHVDLRSFALDAIKTTDICIDKFAKLSGSYLTDKANPANVEAERLRTMIEARAKDKGIDYNTELQVFLDKYESGNIRPEVKTQLISELTQ